MERLKIVPLGGFNKIGMNMMVIEYDDTIVVVDCGASFPDDLLYGIDTSIPNTAYLESNLDKVKGIIITHGHEDHIGGLPYILPTINVPVYGTHLTIALVERKLKDFGIKRMKTKVIKAGNTISLGNMRIEFIKTNHSIPGSVMLAIHTPVGVIVHTGDFKIDYTPINGEPTDLKRLGMLGYKGVLAVIPDSTNALQKGTSNSEMDVAESLNSLFDVCRHGRIFISVFASNVDRVHQIIQLAHKYGRKVVIQGETMSRILEEAERLSLIDIPTKIRISLLDINEYSDSELVFITTGNHGEAFSYLAQVAEDMNEYIKVKPGDNIIFSSIPISGYGRMFSDVIDKLSEKGANVYYQETHVTGHAHADEIKLLYNLLSPKHVIPAHGTYRLRKAAGEIAVKVGIPRENVIYINNGDVLEIDDDGYEITGRVDSPERYVDGLVIGESCSSIVEQRYRIAESGVVLINVCFDAKSKMMTAPPKCEIIGFADKKTEDLISKSLEELSSRIIGRCISDGIAPKNMRIHIKQEFKDFFWHKYQRNPLIRVEIRNTISI
jgi:ribonuclease J